MRATVAITPTDAEKATLEQFARGRSTPARLAPRAKIALKAAENPENKVTKTGDILAKVTRARNPQTNNAPSA